MVDKNIFFENRKNNPFVFCMRRHAKAKFFGVIIKQKTIQRYILCESDAKKLFKLLNREHIMGFVRSSTKTAS